MFYLTQSCHERKNILNGTYLGLQRESNVEGHYFFNLDTYAVKKEMKSVSIINICLYFNSHVKRLMINHVK